MIEVVEYKKKKRKPKSDFVKKKERGIGEILRSYGLPPSINSKKHLRYASPIERGILWYWFSKYIRERDKEKPCISCGEYKPNLQAGHFIPTGSCSWDELVFSEQNVNGECPNCNNRDKRKLRYGIELDSRYGPGTKQALEAKFEAYRGMSITNWKRQEYIEKIAYYQSLL